MPTPFMHMALAQRLIHDPRMSSSTHALLDSNWGAFLLGSIAPDARVSSGLTRVATHFFEYSPVIDPPAVTAMLSQHPQLQHELISEGSQLSFVAGYIGHLVMDEVWCVEMLFPYFFTDWATERQRFLFLHMLLGHMDERDRAKLPDEDYGHLYQAEPTKWLPFISDADLVTWRDVIAQQLAPQGTNLTFKILGQRIGISADDMAAFVHNHAEMAPLWQQVTTETLTDIEEAMYRSVFAAITKYLT